MNLSRFAVQYPITVAMLFLGIILLGVISLQDLGTDLLPDISSPSIVVRLESGEKPPEEMERKYTKNIESFVSQLNNVKRVSSNTLSGLSIVTVEFNWETDMDFALLDVQKAMASFSGDREVENITIDRFDPRTAPIMTVVVLPTNGKDLDAVRNDAERVIRLRLERLDGVAAALLTGGREKEIVIRLKPYHMQAYELKPSDVIGKIRGSNLNQSGGEVEDNEKVYLVKGIGEFREIEDIRSLIIGYKRPLSTKRAANQQQGQAAAPTSRAPIFLYEVADIEYEDKEILSTVRFNGLEGIGIAVYKEAQSNTVSISETVKETIDGLSRDINDVELFIAYDQAGFITSSISEVETAALIGIILAIMVLTLFLRNIKATFIVALSIPISIIATFNLMYFNDLTLNIMTLGGLALGAGMLVDNAIVVMENIFRHRALGKNSFDAAVEGTKEVGNAIIASTITTVIVFMPIVYVKGIGAELFKDQAFTVAFSLISSLFVAFLLIPALSSQLLKNSAPMKTTVRSIFYRNLLTRAVNNRWRVTSIAVVLAALTVLAGRSIGTEFIPHTDQQEFVINVRLPEGTKLETTSSVIAIIEDMITETAGEHLETIYSEVGRRRQQGKLQDEEKDINTAEMHLSLKIVDGKRLSTSSFIEALQPAIEDIPNVTAEFTLQEAAYQQTMGELSGGLVIVVKGPEIEDLRAISGDVAQLISQLDGVYNAKTSFREGRPEIAIELDKVITAGLGITMDEVLSAVRNRISDNVVSEFQFAGDERDIRVAFPLMSESELAEIPLVTSDGANLKLRNIADLNWLRSPRQIKREDQIRIGIVSADIGDEADYSTVMKSLESTLAGIALPPDYKIEVSGEERERRRSFADLKFALVLALILVYMVLASLFESFVHPFTILLAVPMAVIGSILLFFVIGMPISIMAIIGIIMLAGIAVNDAIILVDYINSLRKSGLEVVEAVIQAGQDRLRPIIMTSLTTILALVPLVLGIGEGASLRAPLAYAVIGGLITSTLMTLILTPCLYLILDKLRPVKITTE